MAKQTILICDWCPEDTHAVVTLALTNGHVTRGAPTLDLCGKHSREMFKAFSPRRRKTTQKWPDADKKIWAVLGPEVMTPRAVCAKTGLPTYIVQREMLDMLKAKKLKRTGSYRAARYVKA